MEFFATALPGFGPLVWRELAATPGLRAHEGGGFDGRSDIVTFSGPSDRRLQRLRTCEAVFAGIASVRDPSGARAVSSALEDEQAMRAALSSWVALNGPASGTMTYRLVIRLRADQRFRRIPLRDHLLATLARIHPDWQVDEPARLEFWCIEDRPGELRIGLRLTGDGTMNVPVEALRPSAAAAMVLLAGEARGRLLDPCCGSGAVLAEATARGWEPIGVEIDEAAVAAARATLDSRAMVIRGDARSLPFADAVFAAAVSNLPASPRPKPAGEPEAWLAGVLGGLCRVTGAEAPLVLIVPDSRAWQRALASQPAVTVEERYPVQLLGRRTFLWRLQHD